jgi:hypothetical protein
MGDPVQPASTPIAGIPVPLSVEDIADQWIQSGVLPASNRQVERLVVRSWRVLASKDSTLEERVGSNNFLAECLVDVIVSMVHRVLVNPQGFRTIATGEGPYTSSNTFSGDSPGALVPTLDELRLLGIARKRKGICTVELTRPDGTRW